jgi:ribonucleoside-diphosphate reductase alpha chain
MYMYAWEKGVKTTYYMRSRPATGITKTTTTRSNITLAPAAATETSASAETSAPDKKEYSDAEAITCSLENPESCEACQ